LQVRILLGSPASFGRPLFAPAAISDIPGSRPKLVRRFALGARIDICIGPGNRTKKWLLSFFTRRFIVRAAVVINHAAVRDLQECRFTSMFG
jgi:hypothetical protein